MTNKQAIFKIITPDVLRFLFMRKKPDLKTSYILRLLLFIGWIIVCIPSICQNAKKAFHCFLNDTEAYEKYAIFKVTNSVGIDTIFTVYQIKVTDKSTGKLTEEYFRHDDSCYQFFAYDSSGKVIKRGLLQSYFTGLIDTSLLQIPDLDIDPYGTKGVFKDTILTDSIY